MAGQKGHLMLIKIGDQASPEQFTALAGLRTKSLTINSQTVDITSSDSSNRWRELLAGAGTKNISISGAGVFKDGTPDTTLKTDALAGTIRNYQVIVPDFGTFEGPFQIATLSYSGEQDGEVTYDLSLESGGEITFTAAV